jgi:hypothetical protein
MAARIKELEAVLREIAAMCPVTSDMTTAHAMAQIAEEAISGHQTTPSQGST